LEADPPTDRIPQDVPNFLLHSAAMMLSASLQARSKEPDEDGDVSTESWEVQNGFVGRVA
jgi:hypothetical protein